MTTPSGGFLSRAASNFVRTTSLLLAHPATHLWSLQQSAWYHQPLPSSTSDQQPFNKTKIDLHCYQSELASSHAASPPEFTSWPCVPENAVTSVATSPPISSPICHIVCYHLVYPDSRVAQGFSMALPSSSWLSPSCFGESERVVTRGGRNNTPFIPIRNILG